MLFTRLLLGLATATLALAAPVIEVSPNTDSAPHIFARDSKQGKSGGFYYSAWTNNQGYVKYANGKGGMFAVSWKDAGNFVVGKGWEHGSAKPITYSGSFRATGQGYLSVYGWTHNAMVEYYIVESYSGNPPSAGRQILGQVRSDGGTYDIFVGQQLNQPNIESEAVASFPQYWSVRREKRTSGTVTVKNHFEAWEMNGLKLGAQPSYQIVAVEGFQSSGSAKITVH